MRRRGGSLSPALVVLGALAVARAQDGAGARDVAPIASGTLERKLGEGDSARTYLLHLPKNRKPEKLPLVLSLHGAGASGRTQEGLTQFDRLADEHGFAVCYPDGRHRSWTFVGRSDSGFLERLLDRLVEEGVADPRRIYVTGISNGAYMTNKLALDIPEKIAAIAPVAGTMPKLGARIARKGRPLPVLYIHGTDDPLNGYDGKSFGRRETSLPAEDLVDFWVARSGARKEPTVEQIPDEATDDGATAERRTHAALDGGAEVVFYKVKGGGHTWPGGSLVQPERMLGKTCRDFDASRAIWEFFARHSLPEK